MSSGIRSCLLLTCGVLILVSSNAWHIGHAQARLIDPWFGVRLPPGLGDPHRPVVSIEGIEAPAPLVPPGEEHRPELSGSRIRRDLETIVGFSKASRAAGNRLWGRITGFPSQMAIAGTWTAFVVGFNIYEFGTPGGREVYTLRVEADGNVLPVKQ